MQKLIRNIRNNIQPAVYYIPFTWYFILFAAAAWIAGNWLTARELVPGSSFTDIFALLVKTGLWFLVAFIAIAFLSVLVAYGIFLWRKRKQVLRFSVQTSTAGSGSGTSPVQTVHVAIAPLLKPLLGFIKLRLHYDNDQYSGKFVLAEEQQQKLFTTAFAGAYRWQLPEIKEYQVDAIILYFEDLFQFFSFTVALPVQDRFITQPFSPPVENFTITPQKTEEQSTRIEELKRVEGEFLNYKNFENNDDVRRIVWKIYARNKELVVRIPEILDPYASHANMIVSFYSSFDIEGYDVAEKWFLNYYKSVAWAIYRKTVAQGFMVNYMPDQVTPSITTNDEQQSVQYAITTSTWQQDKDLKNSAANKSASLVVVSSLADAEDIAALLDNKPGGMVVVFVKLSASLQHSIMSSFLKWLFIQQEKNEVEVYRTNWRLSLLRPKIMHNEKQLEALLAKHSKTVVIA